MVRKEVFFMTADLHEAVMAIKEKCKKYPSCDKGCPLCEKIGNSMRCRCMFSKGNPISWDASILEEPQDDDGEANIIDNFCKWLGVDFDEEFRVTNSSRIYRLNKECGLQLKIRNDRWSMDMSELLNLLVIGKETITKIPWKPKKREAFYTVFLNTSNQLTVGIDHWSNCSENIAKYAAGWVFKTYDEASSALPDIANKLNLQYSLK